MRLQAPRLPRRLALPLVLLAAAGLALPLQGLAEGGTQLAPSAFDAARRGPPPRPAGATDQALSAADELRLAITALQHAGTGREQVSALTQTIRAYERGLADLRAGLRKAAQREEEIDKDLAERRERLAKILGAMMVMQQSPAPVTLLHPDGPEAAVEAGLILSDVAPALQGEAQALNRNLEEISAIRQLQQNAAGLLSSGLAAAQTARTNLSQAMLDRTGLPQRFLAEPEELTALVESANSLESFADGVGDMETDIGPPMEDFAAAKGTLPQPAIGTVLRRFNEADAAGIRRPGLVLATRPGALVTTPWPATVRYRGPLLDYGNVMILEPAEGYLLVLAGLGTVYGATGDVLEAGAPVGLMGGTEAATGEDFLAGVQQGGGADRTETLYIELRKGKTPVDPAEWFTETKDD